MGTVCTDYGLYEHWIVRVYTDGRVKVLSIFDKSKNEKELSQTLTKDGYVRVKIKRQIRTVHSLVCEVVYGRRPKGKEINHIDGNKLNNHPSNLEYCTGKQNREHAYRLGLIKKYTAEENKAIKKKTMAEYRVKNKESWNAYQREYKKNRTPEQRKAWNEYQAKWAREKRLKAKQNKPSLDTELIDWISDNIN